MKRIIAAALVFAMLTVMCGSVFAAKTAGQLKSVEYANKDGNETVNIHVAGYTDYSVMELTGPGRIVVDIYGAIAPGKQQHVKADGPNVVSVRYAQFEPYTARVVIEVNGEPEYGINKTETGLQLYFGEMPESTPEAGKKTAGALDNITYSNKGDRVYFTLEDTELTKGEDALKTLYSSAYDKTGLKYSVSFPSELANIGAGTLKINDKNIKTLEVSKDADKGMTALTFTAASKLEYLIYTRSSLHETTITLIKPATAKQKLVVIDAGHGGSAPGAIYKSLVEKDLNLDIAKRLNTLLEKKGVSTYMIREDDSYVANYERAYIANKLRASLYISVHHNSLDDPGFGGTVTLYCPSGSSKTITGKGLADIVQQKLLSALKTVDRKTVARPNLVVLKTTSMPSVIAEIAFLTNSKDRTSLGKASFRQSAAQGLYNAVIKVLPQVK